MAEYALVMSEEERARYRFMAEQARATESGDWAAAGVRAGAAVADVGCGPGATLRVLAEAVGPEGSCVGVEIDEHVAGIAAEEVADLPQARVVVGSASATSLEPARFDVVMCRHVLAHNGGAEPAIVNHLASLARPGGCVYLVDVDMSASWFHPPHDDMDRLLDAYRVAQARRGNDLSVGRRIGALLQDAGLSVELYRGGGNVFAVPVGQRPPAWAARQVIVDEGLADEGDLARWEKAFVEIDQREERPWFYAAAFRAVGRAQP